MKLTDIQAAAGRIGGQVLRTPLTRSETLSRLTGADISLKFENLQFTASFKERGALNCLLQLTDDERGRGVVAMSAGNHAQALAYHGQRLGVPTCLVMPRSTPNAKVEATRVFGAEIHLEGASFDATRAFALALQKERDLTLIHPYDDPRVIAGQHGRGLFRRVRSEVDPAGLEPLVNDVSHPVSGFRGVALGGCGSALDFQVHRGDSLADKFLMRHPAYCCCLVLDGVPPLQVVYDLGREDVQFASIDPDVHSGGVMCDGFSGQFDG
jgi:hypothetical protein